MCGPLHHLSAQVTRWGLLATKVDKRSRPQLPQAPNPNSDALGCFCSKPRLQASDTEAALPQTPCAPCPADLHHRPLDTQAVPVLTHYRVASLP